MNLVEDIRKVQRLYHAKGCNTSQIKEAQKMLDIVFPEEYVDYIKEYGAISFYGTEWTGLNVEGHINVVDATEKERQLNKDFPPKCFVLENLGIDGIITIVDEAGVVYSLHFNKKEKICDSISEYLKICIDRAN
ncbi:SMI1/KNR4 family protein [Butyrivibrio fibrisolvens]|uniref:SMI1/KNR4 family protein n=1 Tax=Butyrivibrio fibrisolvens TaxID=831 RepID=UPI0004246033|nr:SMI1/KNR4 family protein [Butyrivibrio fibrisolvens]